MFLEGKWCYHKYCRPIKLWALRSAICLIVTKCDHVTTMTTRSLLMPEGGREQMARHQGKLYDPSLRTNKFVTPLPFLGKTKSPPPPKTFGTRVYFPMWRCVHKHTTCYRPYFKIPATFFSNSNHAFYVPWHHCYQCPDTTATMCPDTTATIRFKHMVGTKSRHEKMNLNK